MVSGLVVLLDETVDQVVHLAVRGLVVKVLMALLLVVLLLDSILKVEAEALLLLEQMEHRRRWRWWSWSCFFNIRFFSNLCWRRRRFYI